MTVIESQNELIGALLDIHYELRNTPIRPKVVGGLGIFLRARDVFERERQTLLPLAGARATQDIDMILPPETIIVPELRSSFKRMLDSLGFSVITKFAYWQYKRQYYQHEQKLDLHTWMPAQAAKASFRIVGEKLEAADAAAELDAHIASEAIGVESLATEIHCSGYRNSGAFYECTVLVPHPLTLAVMKLLAFRDYENKTAATAEEATRNLRYAQKHALDTYVLLSTVTEDEWNQTKELVAVYAESVAIQQAKAIASKAFATVEAIGMIRMQESLDATPTMQFDIIPSLLFELFGITT